MASESTNGSLLELVERKDGGAARRLQLMRRSLNAEQFQERIKRTLMETAVCDGLTWFLTLVGIEHVFPVLLDVYLRSRREGLALASKLLLCDARLDIALLQHVRESVTLKWPDDVVVLTLDILDAISEGDRLAMGVSIYLNHPNAKLRSKSAMFIARRRPDARSLRNPLLQGDARVRANFIEGLYGADAAFAAPIFREHLADENSRVAGNALLGLYFLGDSESVRWIEGMMHDDRAGFRQTGAWLMGRTGDPRFARSLAAALSDPEPRVRSRALHGLGSMKAAREDAQKRADLRTRTVSAGSDEHGRWLISSVRDKSNFPVRRIEGTRFLLKSDGKYVFDYHVQEYDCANPVQVAFVNCLAPEDLKGRESAFDDAINNCMAKARPDDVLTSCNLGSRLSDPDLASGTEAMGALSQVDFTSPNLHVVLVGARWQTWLYNALSGHFPGSWGQLHVIAMATRWSGADAPAHNCVSGNFLRLCDKPEKIADACWGVYCAILHHYRITCGHGASALEVQVKSSA